ncbi:hypothetical protein [Saccharothrix coeruleofusca]|uniref:hypothetical protein n=1 Tax=Saccharothrix coeruleofusca TaxID=33919 RepID=UPI00166FB2BA|nr:hypothetical protein [Saccharothrix coeruleofusca]
MVVADQVSRYLDFLDEYLRQHPDEREGQAHYNALRTLWPHLQHEIAGTERDCFSLDRNLPAFLAWVEEALAADQRVAEDEAADAVQT